MLLYLCPYVLQDSGSVFKLTLKSLNILGYEKLQEFRRSHQPQRLFHSPGTRQDSLMQTASCEAESLRTFGAVDKDSMLRLKAHSSLVFSGRRVRVGRVKVESKSSLPKKARNVH